MPPSGLGNLSHDTHNALPTGLRLGEFEIRGVIGIGGFGIVYQAFDHALERDVAIKEYMPSSLAGRSATNHVTVLSQGHAETFALGKRSFVNEARLLAKFDHPSLVKVHRFWEEYGTAYMAMPLYRGRTLKAVRQRLPDSPDEPWIRGLFEPMLGALEVLHREGVYHRDIAPDNILIGDDAKPVLLDFGAARRVINDRSQTLTAILKPNYAPIEQYAEAAGLRQGPWTDLYALGATLHFLITGAPPQPATARALGTEQATMASLPRLGFSQQFLQLIDWMLAPRPTDRPQSVAEVRDALAGRIAIPIPVAAPVSATAWERTELQVPAAKAPPLDADATIVRPVARTPVARTPVVPTGAILPPADDDATVPPSIWPHSSTLAGGLAARAQPPTAAPQPAAPGPLPKPARERTVFAQPRAESPAPSRRAVPIVLAVGALLVAGAAVFWVMGGPARLISAATATQPARADAKPDPAPPAPQAPPAQAVATPQPAAPAAALPAAEPMVASPAKSLAAAVVPAVATPTARAATAAAPDSSAQPAAGNRAQQARPAGAGGAAGALMPLPSNASHPTNAAAVDGAADESRRVAAHPAEAPAPAVAPRPSRTQVLRELQQPVVVPPPAPAVAGAPHDQCGGRVFIALHRCLLRVCAAPQYQNHPECIKVRELEERNRRSSYQ